MRKKKVIHLLPDDKFSSGFISFVQDNFPEENHCFYSTARVSSFEIKSKALNSLKQCFNFSFLLVKNRKDKIIFHSLFLKSYLLIIASIFSYVLRDTAWVIWGGDLYKKIYNKKDFIYRVKEFFRRILIRNLSVISCLIKGDYDIACREYQTNAKYVYLVMYPRSFISKKPLEFPNGGERNLIQIGNSSDPSNHHVSALNLLKSCELSEQDQVFLPSCYPKNCFSLQEEVINTAKNIFSEKKVVVLRDFVPMAQYFEHYLSRVKLAIFNHDQQEGIGNLITLLAFGVTVYIRRDIVTWKFCIEHDLIVKNIEMLKKEKKINFLSELEIKQNQESVSKYFSEAAGVKTWNVLFETALCSMKLKKRRLRLG